MTLGGWVMGREGVKCDLPGDVSVVYFAISWRGVAWRRWKGREGEAKGLCGHLRYMNATQNKTRTHPPTTHRPTTQSQKPPQTCVKATTTSTAKQRSSSPKPTKQYSSTTEKYPIRALQKRQVISATHSGISPSHPPLHSHFPHSPSHAFEIGRAHV